jgi:hypothetical protein
VFEAREAGTRVVDGKPHAVAPQMVDGALLPLVIFNRGVLGHLDDHALTVQPRDQLAEVEDGPAARNGSSAGGLTGSRSRRLAATPGLKRTISRPSKPRARPLSD